MNEFNFQFVDFTENWDEFVTNSENGTLFDMSVFQKSLTIQNQPILCYKNKELKAGFVYTKYESNNKHSTDFIIYNTIIFRKPLANQNRNQVYSERFKIITELINFLSLSHKNCIEFRLDTDFADIRPFLWHNYGINETAKFFVEVKYTTLLNITDFNLNEFENTTLYKNASISRRQEIRYGIKKNVKTIEMFDVDKFITFYLLTLERQNLIPNMESVEEMKNIIINLHKTNSGVMFASYTQDGSLGSMAFWGIFNTKAYYLFGASDPNYRDSHTGTMVIWDSIRSLAKNKILEIDLEGVNSPKRGWFKISFGGLIKQFFVLKLNDFKS